MKVTHKKISINHVNEINKKVIDVAFGNECNAVPGSSSREIRITKTKAKQK